MVPSPKSSVNRRRVLSLLACAVGAACLPHAFAGTQSLPLVEVFKSPTCGCCAAWVAHMEREGFQVKVTEVADVGVARARLGIPDTVASCHTATVGRYVLEGHVPAREVKKLLTEKPAALGLAVPGMPMGSPGMEMGQRQAAYDVLLVKNTGAATPYANYPAR